MTLLNFISKVQTDIVFDPRFTGIKAIYSRRVLDAEGDLSETKTAELFISPQGNSFATDRSKSNVQFDARLNIIWARTEDLKFDGEPFLPERGDTIEYKTDKYIVEELSGFRTQSSFGQTALFSYEDAAKKIIKITTIKRS